MFIFKKISLKGYSFENSNYVFFNLKIRFKKYESSISEILILKYFKKHNIIWTNKFYYVGKKILINKYNYDFCLFEPKFLDKFKLRNLLDVTINLHNINYQNLNLKIFPLNDFYSNHSSFEKIQTQIKLYFKEDELKVSHNDLGFNNILVNLNTNQIKLIDFEYVTLNHPYFDYAHILLTYKLNKKQQAWMFNYLNLNTKQKEKLILFAKYICLIFQNYAKDKIKINLKYKLLEQKYKNLFNWLENSDFLEVYY